MLFVQVALRPAPSRAASRAEVVPNSHHGRCPAGHACKSRVEAREQVHAGIDHGRRVDQGAHRGGRLHGVGQPTMERNLRRFLAMAAARNPKATSASQAGWKCLSVSQEVADGVAARARKDDQCAGQQAQAAGLRDEEGP